MNKEEIALGGTIINGYIFAKVLKPKNPLGHSNFRSGSIL